MAIRIAFELFYSPLKREVSNPHPYPLPAGERENILKAISP
ncbi:MAG: hypothetical protein WC455_01955 [Dehalococcoidia bacterium]|jgi:hypothetical protein